MPLIVDLRQTAAVAEGEKLNSFRIGISMQSCRMGELTEANCAEFWARYQLLCRLYSIPDDEKIPFDLWKKCIGTVINANTEPRRKFLKERLDHWFEKTMAEVPGTIA